MSHSSYFFQKKEEFDRGVFEIRTLLRGRDPASLPRGECALFAKKYEALEALCRDMCELSRTDATKEHYKGLTVRLGERARTLRLLAEGKSTKATPDEQRARLIEEFDKRRDEIRRRLDKRRIDSLSPSELEGLAKKYERLAFVAKSISEIARTPSDEKRYGEFYEKLMCRSAELLSMARKLSTKEKKKSAPAPAEATQAASTASAGEDTRERKIKAFRSLSLSLSGDYQRLVTLATELSASALGDEEREEYEYFKRYLAEGYEFYEAVMKKEIQALSADDILSLETK